MSKFLYANNAYVLILIKLNITELAKINQLGMRVVIKHIFNIH